MSVSKEQRYGKTNPCPVCGGTYHGLRGTKKRCWGFCTEDGKWAWCSHVQSDTEGPRRTWRHLLKDEPLPEKTNGVGGHDPIVETYDYRDEAGDLLLQVCRLSPKSFRQRRPGPDGSWIWKLGDVRRPIYRLPEVLDRPEGAAVFLVEGEKDADALVKRGFCATTTLGGAGGFKANAEEARLALAGADVIQIADADEAGRGYARDAKDALDGHVGSYRSLELPGGVKDVFDFFAMGKSVADFEKAIEPRDPRALVYGPELATIDGPVPWVLGALKIGPGRPSVWCGEGGTAKSLLAAWVALHVAAGRNMFGHPVRRMPVLWLDYEAGQAVTKKRLQRMARVMGISLEWLDKNIAYRFRPLYLDSMAKQRELAEFVAGFGLVIVDSIARSAPMLDENRAEAGIPLDLMTGVSESNGTCFVGLDHAGKPSQDKGGGRGRKHAQRGHSRKLDGAGTLWVMSKQEKAGATLVTCEREQIEGVYPDDWMFETLDIEKDGDSRWGLELREVRPTPKRNAYAEILQRILDELKMNPRSSKRKILALVKGRKELAMEAWEELEKKKLIADASENEWVAY